LASAFHYALPIFSSGTPRDATILIVKMQKEKKKQSANRRVRAMRIVASFFQMTAILLVVFFSVSALP